MDIPQFQDELVRTLSNLDYVESVEIYQVNEVILKGKVLLKRNYRLEIRFSLYEKRFSYTLSFTLLLENERIWGLDRDNKIGWHVHPLGNVETHESIEEKSVSEIVNIFNSVFQSLI